MKYVAWFVFIVLLSTSSHADQVQENPQGSDGQPQAKSQTKPEMRGRVVTGYQGWFLAEGDGMELGFIHWGRNRKFEIGSATIDMWPDMSEYGQDEKYPTPYRYDAGSVAHVFSSANPATVLRHFQWMKEYGIGGAMAQRFGNSLRHERLRAARDRVLENVRTASRETGVPWALMYDLSGLKPGEIEAVVMADVRRLIEDERITEDPHYLHHDGQPVIAVWGVGFAGAKREYTLEECKQLVAYLRHDKTAGGNAIMLGVPYWWREQIRDTVKDLALHDLLKQVQIISPWAVGRYRTPKQAAQTVATQVRDDLKWTREHGDAYLPVIFPGFSWANLKSTFGERAKFNGIPRHRGAFLWAQANAAMQNGAEMIYIAMFDEVDEGTAIFKVSANPPTNGEQFLTYEEGLEPDHYLWLAGQIQRALRREISLSQDMPKRAAK